MYPTPNPVAAAQTVARQLRQHATPKPGPPPAPDWWGKHCDFAYTEQTLANWPEVPVFNKGETK